MWKRESHTDIYKPEYSQPACTALQIALVNLLRQWALNPSKAIGHSSGEISAAYCAGILTHQTAIKIAFYRGVLAARLVNATREPGAMLAVALSETDIESHLTELERNFGNIDVEIACINSPKSLTVSGSEKQIDILKTILDRNGTASKKLRVGVAYHSKAMNEVADEYKLLIGDIPRIDSAKSPCIMFSTVTGTLVSPDEVCRAEYWAQNLVCQVRFSESLVNLCSTHQSSKLRGDNFPITDLLEIGPHSALAGPVKDVLAACVPLRQISYNSVLIRGVSAIESSFSTMGRLFSSGCVVDLTAINQCWNTPENTQLLTDLPEYPFNHAGKYWTEGRLFENYRYRTQARHELLGIPVVDWNPLQPRWRHSLGSYETAWVMDHKVSPASGFHLTLT